MFTSGNQSDHLHEGRPRFPLFGKYPACPTRDSVKPAAPLVGLLDPRALDSSAFLEAVEQRIQQIDVKRQRACPDRASNNLLSS